MSRRPKNFTIIAGPNGAGKTTFVQNIFPEILAHNKFINADQFAQNLNPEDVAKVAVTAGKQFLSEVRRLSNSDESFIIETTLSGQSLLKTIRHAKENGFNTRLIFLWISSVELCDFRVKGRVASGGHNIPIEDITRRYKRGLSNFHKYQEAVDECEVFLADSVPAPILAQTINGNKKIFDPEICEQFIACTKYL